MKKVILSIFSATLLFTACQNQTENKSDNDQEILDTTTTTISSIKECYTYTKNRDTASLTFTNTNGMVDGELSYRLFEKDSNNGTIEGEMKGDTLMLTYTFSAEGKESVRQVVMLKKANQLLEGIGETEEKNGKSVFKNTSSLNFEQGIAFSKTDCN